MSAGEVPDWLRGAVAAAGVSGHWTRPGEVRAMPAYRGAYLLALRLDEAIRVELPRLAGGRVSAGWHVYLGSARGSGGVRARVKRHFRRTKKPHWHIDRLTMEPVEMAALAVADGKECELVGKLLASPCFEIAMAGFGSTDCRRCKSHLLAATPG